LRKGGNSLEGVLKYGSIRDERGCLKDIIGHASISKHVLSLLVML
jgi:hypothetical protein